MRSVVLLLLFKAYSDNRVTDFNGFFCGIMPVLSKVFGPCCMHLGVSEDFMLPKNQQSTSDSPRTTDFLLPVTVPIPHLTLEQPLYLDIIQWSSSVACVFMQGLRCRAVKVHRMERTDWSAGGTYWGYRSLG